MALDPILLLVDIEKHFGVQNDDSLPITLGDFHKDILAGRKKEPTYPNVRYYEECRPAVIEYLKKDLAEHFGVDPQEIKSGRLLEELIPREARRTKWKKLQQEAKIKYPDLTLPRWITHSILGAPIFLCAFIPGLLFTLLKRWNVTASMTDGWRMFLSIGIGTVCYFACGIFPSCGNFFFFYLRGFKKTFPSGNGPPTVGALVSELLYLNGEKLYRELSQQGLIKNSPLSQEEESNMVWQGLRWMVAGLLAIQESELTPETDICGLFYDQSKKHEEPPNRN